jgi:hypothetical protein
MKRFLHKTLLFGAGPALVSIGLLLTDRSPPFTMDCSIDTIIIGDSHCQCAIDDAHLFGVTNLSMNSEGYLFSYAKLRFLLQDNPGIKIVLVGFSFHNLSSYYDEYLWGRQSQVPVRRYAQLLTISEKSALIIRSPDTVVSLLRGSLPTWIPAEESNPRLPFLGAFEPINTEKPLNKESMLGRARYQYYAGNNVAAFSVFNRRYLDKIVQLCREQEKRLIFLNTPLHATYRDLVPDIYKTEYESLRQSYGVEVIDFHDLALSDDCFLPDGDHVNSLGAQRVTDYLARATSRMRQEGVRDFSRQ